ncbi:MAG: metallophosphoesterase family protein [Acidilobaceae archaeon]|nr:metallophosphoesterase family protein [Acidilobaceae archaeon]
MSVASLDLRHGLRILHVSDVHCVTENLSEVLSEESYDLVIASGDFECVDTAEALSSARAPAFAVTGNMDGPAVYRKLKALGLLLDGRVVSHQGFSLGGLGGLDVRTNAARLERELREHGRVEIFVSHHPPKGVLDEIYAGKHIGLEEVRKLVELASPRLHLFGHAHERRGHISLGGTTYVNAGPLEEGYYMIIKFGEVVEVEEKQL